MNRLILLFIIICMTSSCKQEEVAFSGVESTPRIPPIASGGGTPGGGNTGGGTEEPEPIIAPKLNLLKSPQSHLLGMETEAVIEVIPGTNPVVAMECSVDELVLPCELGATLLPLAKYLAGDHELHVKITDSIGLQAEVKAEWTVFFQFLENLQGVEVEIEDYFADIIFIIDNSESMQEEQKEVARRINRFFQKLDRLQWRVGIITTDPYKTSPKDLKHNPLADGSLLRFPNGKYYIDSSMKLSKAKKLFSQTIFRPEEGNGHERGIRNMYRAIERSQDPKNTADNRLKNFFRPEASLSIVLVSDEDETLLNGIGFKLKEQEKSKGVNLINLVRNTWGPQKAFRFNSVIVRPGDVSCLKDDGDEKYGHAYAQLSRLTDGVIEDICASDYTGALQKIGADVADLVKSYALDCVPQDVDLDGIPDLKVVSLQGQNVPGYAINDDRLEFNQPLEEGRYEFFYYCPKPVSN